MSVFTEAERRYLSGGRQLGRLATVGADGTPHVVPVAWIYNAARDTIDVGGAELERTKKFRDIARSGRAAIVIDDLESTDPWRPRGVVDPGHRDHVRRAVGADGGQAAQLASSGEIPELRFGEDAHDRVSRHATAPRGPKSSPRPPGPRYAWLVAVPA